MENLHEGRRRGWASGWGRGLALAGLGLLLAGCGSVPLSSLWKMRELRLEQIDPSALRAALVYPATLRLDRQTLRLQVRVERELPPVNGQARTEALEESLALEELHGAAELSPLAGQAGAGQQLRVWRIEAASLARLRALRAQALGWKEGGGSRRLSLGLSFEGCREPGTGQGLRVSSLLRLSAEGEYLAVLRDADLMALLPAGERLRRFPLCPG